MLVKTHDIKKEYYDWLCKMIQIEYPNRSYLLLVKEMYNTPFRWSIPNDDNRLFEGQNLRDEYGNASDVINKPVSILEVILALAGRCKDILVDGEDDMDVGEWFWLLMANVGLYKFTDEMYYELDGSVQVPFMLDRILSRTYARSGKGGLFPLKYSDKDQRTVELWYQMNAYLVENYF